MFHLTKGPAVAAGAARSAGDDGDPVSTPLPDRLIGAGRGAARPLSPARSDSEDEKDCGRCSASCDELRDEPAVAAKAARGWGTVRELICCRKRDALGEKMRWDII